MCLMFENISSGFFMHRMQLTLHIKSISKLTKKYFFGERARACEWSKANTEKVPKIRTFRKRNKYAWIQIRFIHLFTFDASRFEHLILFSADLFTRPLASIFFLFVYYRMHTNFGVFLLLFSFHWFTQHIDIEPMELVFIRSATHSIRIVLFAFAKRILFVYSMTKEFVQ